MTIVKTVTIEIRNAPVGDENLRVLFIHLASSKIEIRNAPVGDENDVSWLIELSTKN